MMKFQIFRMRSHNAKFLVCPHCSQDKGMTVKVVYQSVLECLPVYCRACKNTWMIDYKDGVETVTGKLPA